MQFERVLAVANDLGLLSEEYNVPASQLAGNFPQALTHLAVVNTALGLSDQPFNAAAAEFSQILQSDTVMASEDHYDLIVIGSGPGGASLAHRLAPTGKRS